MMSSFTACGESETSSSDISENSSTSQVEETTEETTAEITTEKTTTEVTTIISSSEKSTKQENIKNNLNKRVSLGDISFLVSSDWIQKVKDDNNDELISEYWYQEDDGFFFINIQKADTKDYTLDKESILKIFYDAVYKGFSESKDITDCSDWEHINIAGFEGMYWDFTMSKYNCKARTYAFTDFENSYTITFVKEKNNNTTILSDYIEEIVKSIEIDKKDTTQPEKTEKIPESTKEQTKTTIIETTTAEPVTEAPTEPKIEDSYQSNEYYDIVETASYVNSIGDTILIHKVLAKQNVSVDSSIIAYSPEGNVIGKSTDDIVLTEGQYNYFRYSFESDISNADLQAKANAKKTSSFGEGDRNAVEMVQYDRAEDDLFITFKQVSDNMGKFSKFKILFYKNDQIVDCDDGYFSIYAENLNGKDTTDVASIWAYGIDFDRIEYIFEP